MSLNSITGKINSPDCKPVEWLSAFLGALWMLVSFPAEFAGGVFIILLLLGMSAPDLLRSGVLLNRTSAKALGRNELGFLGQTLVREIGASRK